MTEEWEIWDEKEKVTKSEKEAKKFVFQRFYKCIYIFRKKQSERVLIKKVCVIIASSCSLHDYSMNYRVKGCFFIM